MANLHRATELSALPFTFDDTIRIYNPCKYLKVSDIGLILNRIRVDYYNLDTIITFLKPLRYYEECWIRSDDWSEYCKVNTIAGHRFSFHIFKGELRSSREICHKCDRKGCVNPDHLFQGSHTENMRDARIKGRMKDSPEDCQQFIY